MSEQPSIPDIANIVDDITPSSHNESTITMSSAKWAMHRYAMAAMMLTIIGIGLVWFGFMLWDRQARQAEIAEIRREVDLLKNGQDKIDSAAMKMLMALEGRTTMLERTQTNIMDATTGTRADIRIMDSKVTNIQQDVAVLKAKMAP